MTCGIQTAGSHWHSEYQAPLPANFPSKDKKAGRKFTHFRHCVKAAAISVATFEGCVLALLVVSGVVVILRKRKLAGRSFGL